LSSKGCRFPSRPRQFTLTFEGLQEKSLVCLRYLVAVQALTPDATLIHGARGDSLGNILIPRVSDWRLAVTASVKVIATVEEFVAGPLQDQPDWRLIPAIHLTALVHCPGGAGPTGYPGYYPQDEAHLALYLESTRTAAAFTRYLEDHVWGRAG
jgi:glutaconate CoA-transferase subunit A